MRSTDRLPAAVAGARTPRTSSTRRSPARSTQGFGTDSYVGYQYSASSSATYNGNAASTINAVGYYIYVDPNWKFTASGSDVLMFPEVSGPNYLADTVTVEYGTSNATSIGGNAGDPVLELYDPASQSGYMLYDLASSSAAQYLSNGGGQGGWIYVQQQQQNGNVSVWLWSYTQNSLVEQYSAAQGSGGQTGYEYLTYYINSSDKCYADPNNAAVGLYNYFVGNFTSGGGWGWMLPQSSNTNNAISIMQPTPTQDCFGSTSDYSGYDIIQYDSYGSVMLTGAQLHPTVMDYATNPSNSGGSTTTLSFPSGACPANQMIVIAIGYNGGSATNFSFSGGGIWNIIRSPVANASTGYDTYGTYWHWCLPNEPSSYTITASGSPLSNNNFNFVAAEIGGASSSTPVYENPNIVYQTSTSVSGTLNACGVVSNCLPISIGFNGSDHSAPACSTGTTITYAVSNDGSGPGMTLCGGVLTTTQSAVSIGMTQSPSDFFAMDMLMIAPAGYSGGTPGPTPTPTASAGFVRRTGCASNSTQNLTCTLTTAIAAGDVGIVTAAVYNGAAVSINSITNATIIDNGGAATNNVLASAWAGAGISSVTVNTSAAASYIYVEVDEYSGVNTTTPIDKHAAPTGATHATTCSPTTLTPTQAGDLAVEYVGNFTVSSNPAQGTYATSPSTTTTIEGNSSGGILALEGWSNDNSTSAITGTWTWSTAQDEQCGLLLLNPAGVTSTPVPTSTPTAQGATPSPPSNPLSHVLTGDYCCGGSANDTPAGGLSSAAPYIAYYANPSANSSTGYSSYGTPGLVAAGIAANRVYAYVDDSRVYQGDTNYSYIEPGGSDQAAGAVGNTDCSSPPNEIQVYITEPAPQPTIYGYLSDPYQQSATVQLYNRDVGTQASYSSEYGIMFLDDIEGYRGNTTNNYQACHNGSPWSEPATASAYASLINAITVNGNPPPTNYFLLNALLPMLGESNASPSALQNQIAALVASPTILGLDCEECLADGSNAVIGNGTSGELSTQWTLVEDAAIDLVNLQKLFWLQDQYTGSTNAIAGRLFSFASFMLVWNPTLTVYQNVWYGTPSDGSHPNSTNPQIHVFPEELLTAYAPFNPQNGAYPTASQTITALQDPGGTFYREYWWCYYNGQLVNASGAFHGCAFVVNPAGSGVSYPHLQGTYNHTLSIGSSNDVIDGGISTTSLTAATPAPSATMAQWSAAIFLP